MFSDELSGTFFVRLGLNCLAMFTLHVHCAFVTFVEYPA